MSSAWQLVSRAAISRPPAKAPALRGSDYDRWDLMVRGGMLGGARTRMTIEKHGADRQFVRIRVWPSVSAGGIVAALALAVLASAAASDGAGLTAEILGAGVLFVMIRAVWDCGAAQSAIGDGLGACKADWTDA